MWNSLKRALLSNIGLKISAIVAAILLWIVVVNVEDPSRSKFFTAKVDILNQGVLTDNGKYYEMKDDESTVTFRVTAKRSIIEKLSNSDFRATADLNYLGADNRVPVDIEASRFASQVTISSRSFYINLKVGNIQKKRFSIKPVTTGKPADGTVVSDVTATPNVITVSGPDKIVSTISTVEAVTDVTGVSKDFSDDVVPVLKDKNGREIDASKLTLSRETVQVNVITGSVKKVKITAQTSGQLPEGYTLNSVTVVPGSVEVSGDVDALNSLTEIIIPGSVIDLSSITKDLETTVDISSYLPNGIELVNPDDKTVKVKVKVDSATSKNFSIPTANLTVGGLPDGLQCEFIDSSISVAIKGMPQDLEKLDSTKITGRIDASGLNAGTHHVTVTLVLSSEYSVDTITTGVKITEKNN